MIDFLEDLGLVAEARVAEGWARGAEADKGARWDPAELGPVVTDLLAKSRTPLPVFGA